MRCANRVLGSSSCDEPLGGTLRRLKVMRVGTRAPSMLAQVEHGFGNPSWMEGYCARFDRLVVGVWLPSLADMHLVTVDQNSGS